MCRIIFLLLLLLLLMVMVIMMMMVMTMRVRRMTPRAAVCDHHLELLLVDDASLRKRPQRAQARLNTSGVAPRGWRAAAQRSSQGLHRIRVLPSPPVHLHGAVPLRGFLAAL